MKRLALLLVALVISACTVSGTDVISEGEPDFARFCADSVTVVDTTRYCWTGGVIEWKLVIQNPNPLPPGVYR